MVLTLDKLYGKLTIELQQPATPLEDADRSVLTVPVPHKLLRGCVT
jgi:hypothetical protein